MDPIEIVRKMEQVFLVILFASLLPGLILLAISRRYQNRIDVMDAAYTGNIIKDPEAEAWYHYGRKINFRIMKATKYIGYIFLCPTALIFLMYLIETLFPVND